MIIILTNKEMIPLKIIIGESRNDVIRKDVGRKTGIFSDRIKEKKEIILKLNKGEGVKI